MDEGNNTYHNSIREEPIRTEDYALSEEIKSNNKTLKFKANHKVRITKHKNNFRKCFTKNRSREICVINSALNAKSFVV